MNEKSKTIRLSPVIPSSDLPRTMSFLVEALDFEIRLEMEDYAVLGRDGYDLHLCPSGDEIVQMSVYLEVSDLEATWKKFSTIPVEAIRVREPFEQGYGMKEFHFEIPATETLLFVGQRSQ